MGNKDAAFINERRFYLERFLKKMAAFPFILNSAEFQAFARPAGDIEKGLSLMIRLSTADIAKRYTDEMKVSNEAALDIAKKEQLESQCKAFQTFAKTIIPVLKSMQK